MHPRVAPRSHDAATLSIYFIRPILIGASLWSLVLEGESSIALTYVSFNARALIDDPMDQNPLDLRAIFSELQIQCSVLPHVLQRRNEEGT